MIDFLPGKIHATSLYLPDPGAGVLLCGPSGAGKSDLALRMVDGGARLISDDYTALADRDGALRASAPENIAGLLEVRGLGVIKLDETQLEPSAPLHLFVELVPAQLRGDIDRLPDAPCQRIGRYEIAKIALCAFDAAAPAKLRAAARLALDPSRRIE